MMRPANIITDHAQPASPPPGGACRGGGGKAPRSSSSPESWAVDVPAFDRWVAGAAPGERMLYARGEQIPRHAPAWSHARELAEDEVITLTSGRDPENKRAFCYYAVRVAAPIAQPTPAPPVEVNEDDPTELVLRAIRRAANLRLPCPTNASLATTCGLKDAAAASYRIRCLVQSGQLRIEDQGPGKPRIATIVGTGKQTRRGA
ncbi:hypothetical protein [Sphingomonas sp.]|uniref:hypothetical protein n=1 Tax=Sphingomonas sp. TaxID=28214 RepID=UPI00260A0605|nr:hypothetical protein [Sphingomonas sp.]MDF2494544.1 hypothetical protein [Sphingomonas sp.]